MFETAVQEKRTGVLWSIMIGCAALALLLGSLGLQSSYYPLITRQQLNNESLLRVRQRVGFLRILRPPASLSFCGGSLTRYVSDQIAAGKFVR